MVQFNFNATEYDPNVSAADVVPSGVYPVQITSTEMKPTKDGSGQYLQIDMAVTDGEFKGCRIVDRLNVQNRNSQAVDIAFRTLSAICHVVGILQMNDTSQLHGRPFKVKVAKVARQDDPTKEGNEVKGYFDVNDNEPKAGAGASPQGAPAAPPAPPQQAPAAPPPQQPAQQPPAQAEQPPAAPAPAAPPQQPAAQPGAQQPPAAPPWAQ